MLQNLKPLKFKHNFLSLVPYNHQFDIDLQYYDYFNG